MSSKKILLNSMEAFYMAGGTGPDRVIRLDWISGNIHRRFQANHSSIHITDENVVYMGTVVAFEILDLNGFNYGDAEPDYSVLDEIRIGQGENVTRQFDIDFTEFIERIYTSNILEQMGAVILDDFLRSREQDWSGQNIDLVYTRDDLSVQINVHSKNYDVFEEHIIVQPFSYKIEAINETSGGADDGIMRVLEAWGGPGILNYRIVTGPDTRVYQASNEFIGLPDGSYTGQVKDADGPVNTSIQFAFTIGTDP